MDTKQKEYKVNELEIDEYIVGVQVHYKESAKTITKIAFQSTTRVYEFGSKQPTGTLLEYKFPEVDW